MEKICHFEPSRSLAMVAVLLAAFLCFTGGASISWADSSTTQSASSSSSSDQATVHQGSWSTSDDGHRYFVDSATGLPVEGFFQANGKSAWYYGEPHTGYVATGAYQYADGQVLLASSTGKLYSKAGWLDSASYSSDNSSQRYYLEPLEGHDGIYVAKTGFFKVASGSNTYTYYGIPSTGAIARGTYKYGSHMLLASPTAGRLYSKQGWLQSSSYTSGSTRRLFYMELIDKDNGIYAAKTGFFKATANGKIGTYYGIKSKGYVAKGTCAYKGYVLLSNKNTGRLSMKSGWKKSALFTTDGKKHRFYLELIDEANGIYAAKTGFFTVGSARYYAVAKKGYVIQEPYQYSSTLTLVPNPSTGKLYSKSGWLKSSKYAEDGATHKYRFKQVSGNKGYYAARTGKFTVSSKSYYGIAGKGYVHQNDTFSVPGDRYVANKDGQIKKSTLLYGIDVSSYQQDINLTKVDADFVMIKATEGTSYTNPYWSTMAKQALSKKKLIGFYHYASGGSANNATKEADYFVDTVQKYIGQAVLVLDWEGDARASGVSYAKAFLDRVKERTGVTPMIYLSKNDTYYYDWSEVAPSYPLWVAQYANYSIMTYVDDPWTDSNGYGAWSGPLMFQYTSTGRVTGYSSNLDLDLFYASSTVWKSYCKTS